MQKGTQRSGERKLGEGGLKGVKTRGWERIREGEIRKGAEGY